MPVVQIFYLTVVYEEGSMLISYLLAQFQVPPCAKLQWSQKVASSVIVFLKSHAQAQWFFFSLYVFACLFFKFLHEFLRLFISLASSCSPWTNPWGLLPLDSLSKSFAVENVPTRPGELVRTLEGALHFPYILPCWKSLPRSCYLGRHQHSFH